MMPEALKFGQGLGIFLKMFYFESFSYTIWHYKENSVTGEDVL